MKIKKFFFLKFLINKMSQEEPKELKFNVKIREDPLFLEVTCDRKDEDKVYRMFESSGFVASVRSPGYMGLRRPTFYEKYFL